MVIKVAVPNQFKLKIIPGIRTFLFPDDPEIKMYGSSGNPLYRRIGDSSGTTFTGEGRSDDQKS